MAAGELLERLVAAYEHQSAQQKIALLLDVQPGLPEINVDPERIEQVLGNLVSNALRYTPEAGEIRLSASQAVNGVILSVRDNGSGIPPEVLPHIFERSYRGDAARQGDGSGLGLSIAKSIIELHGGTIKAASDGPGKGAIFSIFFPV
jgi:signal transduction histidine kinase